jgi:hypothetical protein
VSEKIEGDYEAEGGESVLQMFNVNFPSASTSSILRLIQTKFGYIFLLNSSNRKVLELPVYLIFHFFHKTSLTLE